MVEMKRLIITKQMIEDYLNNLLEFKSKVLHAPILKTKITFLSENTDALLIKIPVDVTGSFLSPYLHTEYSQLLLSVFGEMLLEDDEIFVFKFDEKTGETFFNFYIVFTKLLKNMFPFEVTKYKLSIDINPEVLNSECNLTYNYRDSNSRYVVASMDYTKTKKFTLFEADSSYEAQQKFNREKYIWLKEGKDEQNFLFSHKVDCCPIDIVYTFNGEIIYTEPENASLKVVGNNLDKFKVLFHNLLIKKSMVISDCSSYSKYLDIESDNNLYVKVEINTESALDFKHCMSDTLYDIIVSKVKRKIKSKISNLISVDSILCSGANPFIMGQHIHDHLNKLHMILGNLIFLGNNNVKPLKFFELDKETNDNIEFLAKFTGDYSVGLNLFLDMTKDEIERLEDTCEYVREEQRKERLKAQREEEKRKGELRRTEWRKIDSSYYNEEELEMDTNVLNHGALYDFPFLKLPKEGKYFDYIGGITL